MDSCCRLLASPSTKFQNTGFPFQTASFGNFDTALLIHGTLSKEKILLLTWVSFVLHHANLAAFTKMQTTLEISL